MRSHTAHDRRIHPGSGRRRGPTAPKGRQVDPAALAEVQAPARRPRAAARPADRAPASAAGPFRLPACPASGGAGRGDAAGAGRGLRGRLVLRPFRHRDGRRGAAAAGHGAGLRQPFLRAGRRRAAARRVARPARRRRPGGAGAVHGRLRQGAGRRDRPRAARERHRRELSPRRWRPATRIRMSRPIPVSTATAPAAAMRCCRPAWRASARSTR